MKNFGDCSFVKSGKMARVTFSGWDGRSYNGEARNLSVYTNANHPGKEFVRAMFNGSRCYHIITDQKHPVSGETMVEFFDYYDAI